MKKLLIGPITACVLFSVTAQAQESNSLSSLCNDFGLAIYGIVDRAVKAHVNPWEESQAGKALAGKGKLFDTILHYAGQMQKGGMKPMDIGVMAGLSCHIGQG